MKKYSLHCATKRETSEKNVKTWDICRMGGDTHFLSYKYFQQKTFPTLEGGVSRDRDDKVCSVDRHREDMNFPETLREHFV